MGNVNSNMAETSIFRVAGTGRHEACVKTKTIEDS